MLVGGTDCRIRAARQGVTTHRKAVMHSLEIAV
jgi:hypothetical protein